MRGRLSVGDKVGDRIIDMSVNGQCLRASARLVSSSSDLAMRITCLGVFVWSNSLIVQRSVPRLVVSRIW